MFTRGHMWNQPSGGLLVCSFIYEFAAVNLLIDWLMPQVDLFQVSFNLCCISSVNVSIDCGKEHDQTCLLWTVRNVGR